MEGQKCPFCGSNTPPKVEMCEVCGFRFVERPISTTVDLTDEQIAALAGYAEQSYSQKERSKQRPATKLEKTVKWVFLWVILPGIIFSVAQSFHLIPTVSLPGITKDRVSMNPSE